MSVVKRERQSGSEMTWPDERVDRAFRDMFRDFFTGGLLMDRFAENWSHPMHLEEFVEGDTCVIRAEIPGVDPEKDIEITVADGIVHISAHREERKEEERPSGYRSEFRYGSFSRSVRLPEGATEADVTATYKDGVLEVRIPVAKAERPQAAKIKVEHA